MLFWHELKKVLSMTALWAFVVLCIAFNIWTIPTGLNTEFDTDTPFPVNVFEAHNTSEIAEAYISFFSLTDRVAERMRVKYDALQVAVDERAITGDSFFAYFGEHTYDMHMLLFQGVGIMGRLLFQGILLAVLVTLFSVGYEKANHTEHSVYATKVGRHILRYKIAASLAASIGIYAILTIVTLTIYFSVFDYSNVWSSSISSGFNFIRDLTGDRPFITWQSFTVVSYLMASLGVSVVLIICFSLMGTIIGTLTKNAYIGFLVVVLVNALCIVLPVVIPRNLYAHYISFHTPILLWWNSEWWFTDGGIITLWRNFELWGVGISFLVLTVLCILAVKNFEKRNIA